MITINNNSRILFFGDSITDIKFNRRYNYKLKGKKIYALNLSRVIKKKCPKAKIFYKGIASNRVYHLYDRMTKDCISLKPNVIILLIGVNDAWEHYVPEEYPDLRRPMKPHLDEIYRRIKTELDDVQILCLLPFMIDTQADKLPFHKILDEYTEVLRQTAVENDAEIVDLQSLFYKAQKEIEPKKLAVDGIHPTNLGHKIISDEILKHLTFK